MKQKFLKMVVMLLAFSLLASIACSSVEAVSVKKFSDVPSSYWGYRTIMQMTAAGIFKGTTEAVNGVATFSPEKEMTRAEFITASLRAIYPTETKNITNGKNKWWDNYYTFAIQKGIVKRTELDGGDLAKAMTREEMAMIMVRCVENNGEKLIRRIGKNQIPDYSKISSYYRDYVLDCFSFGLLCGVDDKGTFNPDKPLTRAQAATVICRLIDKDVRIEVEFNNNNQGNTDVGENVVPQEPEVEENIELPWENGGKRPSEYTWAEYEALPESMKNAFYESFESQAVFQEWFNKVQGSQGSQSDLPWESGGKQPSEYTWAEYEALPDSIKNAFYESFESEAVFKQWFNKVQGSQGSQSDLPWENGGKQPSEYTWAEYEALPDSIKNAFYESFESQAVFEKWFNKVQGSQGGQGNLPWDNGGKLPSEYTWAEFDALSDEMKNAFVNSFNKPGDFADWLNANKP